MKTSIHPSGTVEIVLVERLSDNQHLTPVLTLTENVLGLWGEEWFTKEIKGVYYEIPNWLAYGIRELVKNKIEQDNDG